MKNLSALAITLLLIGSSRSYSAFNPTVEALRPYSQEYQTLLVQAEKVDNLLQLKIWSSLALDAKGGVIPSGFFDTPGVVFHINRIIRIPLKAQVNYFGIKASAQIGGNADPSSGEFTNFDGKTISDLFTFFKGHYFNLGLIAAGAGYGQSRAANGILFTKINGAILAPLPEALGMNVGVSAILNTISYRPVGEPSVELQIWRADTQQQTTSTYEESINTIQKLKLVDFSECAKLLTR